MDTSETKLFQNIKNYNKIFLVTIFSIILYILAAVYNDAFYFMIPTKSYLTWHMVLEVASVLVSFSIFTVTYFIYEESSNLKVLILGCSFLLMAWLDIFHTFSYRGMPYFFMENITSNRATILWVLSRLFGSLGFLLSLLIPSIVISNVRKEIYAALTTAFAIILFIIVTYFPNFFPAMYIEGEGLTNIKILLEYFIILLLGISFIIASNRYKKLMLRTSIDLWLL